MPNRVSPARTAARAASWPLRRFFWPQFEWIRALVIEADRRITGRVDHAQATIETRVGTLDTRVGELQSSVVHAAESSTEALALAGQELRGAADWIGTLHGEVAQLREELAALRAVTGSDEGDDSGTLVARVGDIGAVVTELRGDVAELRFSHQWLASLEQEIERASVTGEALDDLRELIVGLPTSGVVGGSVGAIDKKVADLLNYAESHQGFRAQSDLWFNPSVQVAYVNGGVRPAGVNERIVEHPYVFRALADLPQGARILDVGAAESTVSLSLASLGHRVTALDLRVYPLAHPNIEAIGRPLEEWDDAEEHSYDAVICLSSIEHFGIGAYGEDESAGVDHSDREAIERLAQLVRPGGVLALTTPYGIAQVTRTERVYDREGLESLLEGWTIEDVTIARQSSPGTWEITPNWGTPDDDRNGVAMVTARAPGR